MTGGNGISKRNAGRGVMRKGFGAGWASRKKNERFGAEDKRVSREPVPTPLTCHDFARLHSLYPCQRHRP